MIPHRSITNNNMIKFNGIVWIVAKNMAYNDLLVDDMMMRSKSLKLCLFDVYHSWCFAHFKLLVMRYQK